MKKVLLVILVLSSIFLAGCGRSSNNQTETGENPNISTPLLTKPIEESIEERPYVSLQPTTDGHWVDFSVKKVNEEITGLEYDLLYMADIEGNRIEKGVSTGGQPMDLTGKKEFSKKILFGSASCTTGTCKYKYDENVTEGTLSLKLIGKSGSEKYETSYRIQRGKEAKEGLTTGDGIFSFISSALPANNLYLTISCIGLPNPLSDGLSAKSIPYAIFPLTSTKGMVSFKTSLTSAKIYLLDGQKWQGLETTIADGVATASTPKAGVFILIE